MLPSASRRRRRRRRSKDAKRRYDTALPPIMLRASLATPEQPSQSAQSNRSQLVSWEHRRSYFEVVCPI
jgi:hypothetical protein